MFGEIERMSNLTPTKSKSSYVCLQLHFVATKARIASVLVRKLLLQDDCHVMEPKQRIHCIRGV